VLESYRANGLITVERKEPPKKGRLKQSVKDHFIRSEQVLEFTLFEAQEEELPQNAYLDQMDTPRNATPFHNQASGEHDGLRSQNTRGHHIDHDDSSLLREDLNGQQVMYSHLGATPGGNIAGVRTGSDLSINHPGGVGHNP
jgi:hypothetical protein